MYTKQRTVLNYCRKRNNNIKFKKIKTVKTVTICPNKTDRTPNKIRLNAQNWNYLEVSVIYMFEY